MLPRSLDFSYEEPASFDAHEINANHLKLLYLLSLYSHCASDRCAASRVCGTRLWAGGAPARCQARLSPC